MIDHEQFLVRHALRVRGLAAPEDLAEITGVAEVGPLLEQLVAEEVVRLRTGRVGGYALTKAAREAHPALVAATVTERERAGVGRAYDAFLPVNGRFKDVCTRWQMTDGGHQPNDHSDPEYDAKVIEDLTTTHDEVVAALQPAIPTAPRFAQYVVRFEAALGRIRNGDHAAFARPMSHSYHDVWMELHEDLLLTLGRERESADGH